MRQSLEMYLLQARNIKKEEGEVTVTTDWSGWANTDNIETL